MQSPSKVRTTKRSGPRPNVVRAVEILTEALGHHEGCDLRGFIREAMGALGIPRDEIPGAVR